MPDAPALPDRYEDLGLISLGGMGEVRRVFDRRLRRPLAMKLLRAERCGDADAEARFLEEAQVTAQLQHPGIVPVHDQGRLSCGRPYFTLKEIVGRTLKEVIDAVHDATTADAWGETADGWTLRRLVATAAQVCETVAYAHARGLTHRDLKPSNVMVGEYGEVLVVDWGLVKVGSAPGGSGAHAHPSVVSDRAAEPTLETVAGAVAGTPAYMAPEQAAGDGAAIGPPSDVWALGSILYTLLSGRAPYEGDGPQDILRQLRLHTPAPIYRRPRGEPPQETAELTVELAPVEAALAARTSGSRGDPLIPSALATLCRRAMTRDPQSRPSAHALAAELTAWLDGARRRERALTRVEEARAMLPAIARLRAEALELRRSGQAILEALRPWEPEHLKHAAWEALDAAEAREQEIQLTEITWLQTLRGALNEDPDLPEAHADLADHYQARMADAEARRDPQAAGWELMLRHHDRGRHAAWLRGDGAITLVTDPPGARVTALPYQLRHRRLVPGAPIPLGQSPLRRARLAPGSYLLHIEAPGRATVRYPVQVARGAHWDGIPPQVAEAAAIPLPELGALGPDDRYVPAGPFVYGGDPDGVDAMPRGILWVEGFVIRAFPVTNAEYLAFLAHRRQLGAELPDPLRPISGSPDHPSAIQWDDGAQRFRLHTPAAFPEADPAREPVLEIPWAGAAAYARWYGERAGAPWRLPHEWEWAKAARGVDGRLFPWGDFLDPTWARVLNSGADTPRWGPVDGHPVDESPYGVRGMAGNVRDWCLNPYTREPPASPRLQVDPAEGEPGDLRVVRGGAWSSAERFCRAASRFADRPDARFNAVGLRLCRPWPTREG